jgi:hypothetical protein
MSELRGLATTENRSMEDVMKAYTIVIGSFLIAGASLSAQAQNATQADDCRAYLSAASSYQRVYVEKAVRNYKSCLDVANAGVVESALAHVAKLKLLFPKINCRGLEERIGYLSTHGQTPSIRYKACLTAMLFDNPDMFAREAQVEYKDSNELFGALASKF